ncbi:MAG TPA: hypothetical protein VKX46_14650 [Ktedonobacteraceae bacterium]|nr:hypothetical protein [Ktedonobacteraceae bacterium]
MVAHSSEQIALLTNYTTDSAYCQAYQNLFNTICFDWDLQQQRQHTLLLTTPAPSHGQAAAANVAITAAQNGTPALLVDADLHSASLGQRFGLRTEKGVSDLLATGPVTLPGLTPCVHETTIPDLFVVSAGSSPQQPLTAARLLTAELQTLVLALRQFLDRYASRPALIIFNSPPVLAGIDAALISAVVDQTFLVITSGHTTRIQAKKAQEQLMRAHAQLAGMIMLDV